jgi:hypothetical protein
VAHAAPEVDDLLAAVVCGAGGTELAALAEVARELVAHSLESWRDVSPYHGEQGTRPAAITSQVVVRVVQGVLASGGSGGG